MYNIDKKITHNLNPGKLAPLADYRVRMSRARAEKAVFLANIHDRKKVQLPILGSDQVPKHIQHLEHISNRYLSRCLYLIQDSGERRRKIKEKSEGGQTS